MKNYNNRRKQRTGSKAFIAGLATVVLFGIIIWQYFQISSLERQVDDLNQQDETSTTNDDSTKDEQKPIVTDIYQSVKLVDIQVFSPKSDDTVASPLAIVGRVPGNWSFEANFPVILQDSEGNIIAQGPAQVLGDWMTEDMVPFSAVLTWTSTERGDGTLILQKSNPSGLPENDDSVSIAISLD